MKNKVNKQIFKALALAIAATMAISSPISVVAEDNVARCDNVINDYKTTVADSPNENDDIYHNLETSGTEENEFKKTNAEAADTAANNAASIASEVAQAISDSEDAVDNAEDALLKAEEAATKLDGAEAKDGKEKVESQIEIANAAVNTAKVAVEGDTNNKGVKGIVEETNSAADDANDKYQNLVNAASANKNSANATVGEAAGKLGELSQEVADYNNEAWSDQLNVWGDAAATHYNNYNNMQAVNAVNETTEDLNDRIEKATTQDELDQIKTEAKENVKAATDAVTTAKEDLDNAVAQYNFYAMKYGQPLYGQTEVTYTDADVKAAGITPMSLTEIDDDYAAIMGMSISEARVQSAANEYWIARNAYYGAASDLPDAISDAWSKIGTAKSENKKANNLEEEIKENIEGKGNKGDKNYVSGAQDYLAELDDFDADELLEKIEQGRQLVEEVKGREATENQEAKEGLASSVINYDVNKAQAAVDSAQKAVNATQIEIDRINAQFDDKINEDGTVTKGINSKIADEEAKITAYENAVTAATNNANSASDKNSKIYSALSGRWNSMEWYEKIPYGFYDVFCYVKYSEEETKYINAYVANDATVRATKTGFDSAKQTLGDGKTTGLYKQESDLKAQLTKYNNTLTSQNATLAAANNELTKAQNALSSENDAILTAIETSDIDAASALSPEYKEYVKSIAKSDKEAREAIIAIIREEYLKTSDNINQTEFDEDLYEWAEDSRFWDAVVGYLFFNREAKNEVKQAANARIEINDKYNEKKWRKYLDYNEFFQWMAGTKNLQKKIAGCMSKYKDQLDAAENKYYDALAAGALATANEAETSLDDSYNALNTEDTGLQDKIDDINNRINILKDRNVYEDKTDDINALTRELKNLTLSVKGLIQNNMFDGRNYQLAQSLIAINNAKRALSVIQYQAWMVRGSVKKVDLVSLEWAIKWAEGEVYLATLAQQNAQAALDKLPADQQNPSGPSGDDTTGGGDDTTTGGGDDTTPVIPVAVTPVTNVVTPVVENANPAVLGARTTRRTAAKTAADTDTTAVDNSNNDNAAVAGAQKEETKTPEAPKEETKIEDNDTALAATPELEEKGFAWWWLLIVAAIAGVSVEEYARRKSNKAKAEAKDDAKINK